MMATTYRPRFAVHPGAHLDEKLEELGMSQAELSRRTGLSQKHISQLINGEVSLSPKTALLLERVTKMPASLWNNLESRWQTHLMAQNDSLQLEDQEGWASNFPVEEMKNRGLITRNASGPDLVSQLLSFFGIGSVGSWTTTYEKVVTAKYRTAKGQERNADAIAAWLREAEVQALSVATSQFDPKLARALPEELRRVTRDSSAASHWWPELVSLFAEAGIALVLVREYPGLTKLNGSSCWISPHKALIAVTGRMKRADVLWFTILHELGHVVLHKKRETFIDVGSGPADDELEEQADAYAVRSLIPDAVLPDFEALPHRSLQAAIAFADQAKIHPSIVIGRLQHEDRLPQNYGVKKYREQLDLERSYWTVTGDAG